MSGDAIRRLLAGPPAVVHMGIEAVAEGAHGSGAAVTELDFQPPAGCDPGKRALLARLAPHRVAIEQANRRALERMLASEPHLVGVGVAADVIPGMEADTFLHAGPPIRWTEMSGPLRGAVIGGMLLEGIAQTPEQAERLATRGAVSFEPCHAHGGVGPMAGLVTPSMPVWIVEDRAHAGRRSFCTLNEGLGKVLRYGAYAPEVLERLRFLADGLAPVLADTLAATGPIDLRSMVAQALQMGDEGHNRNRAGTSLLLRELAAAMVGVDRPSAEIAAALAFIHANDHFFLNLSMPMCKCMLMAAEGDPLASMVTVMARNGTEFGIQLASMPGRWFTGPAQHIEGLYFPGFGAEDANPDIGDSAITETAGLGGFAMAASPAIVQFVGGTVADALATSRAMRAITIGRNPGWALPPLDFAGTATGIDLLRVHEHHRLPTINTGVAHREPGVGQVGAGLVHPPWRCFDHALAAFTDHVTGSPEGTA